MRKWSYSIVCGVVLILVTIVLYIVILNNLFAQLMNFITLCGVVVAEVIAVGLAFLSKGEPRRLGAVVLFTLMVPYAIALSIVYIINFPTGYFSYIAWYFAGFLVAAGLSVVLFVFGARRQSEQAVLQDAKNSMLEMRKLTKMIAATEAGCGHAEALRRLEEQLHYSNDSVIAPQDAEIRECLLNLRDNIAKAEYDAEAEIAKIAEMVEIRTISARTTV